jgi:elongation factor Ts
MAEIITAALVKTLRDRTDAPMMECKKILVKANGDIELAIKMIREAGLAKAVKKADRVAAEGVVVVAQTADRAVLLEVNCETDFVAREEKFQTFSKKVADAVLKSGIDTVSDLLNSTLDGATVEARRLELVSQIGENISIRRASLFQTEKGVLGAYGHGGANGVRIGAMVELSAGDAALARDIAMQVAAMNPEYIDASEIPVARVNSERAIFMKQTEEEGKAADKIPMIVEGKIKKWSKEITLLGQSFVKDPSVSIEALLKKSGAQILRFTRFEVGEGIEKKTDNFVEEVMAQARGA